jgi:capsular exopolysaccharide synthesis family protein
MRRPSIAKAFDLPQDRAGLAELITGKAKFLQCLAHSNNENLDVLSSGVVPEDPLVLLSAHQLKQLLQALRTRYDRIIIDCPPAIPVSDSAVLSTFADSVVFVVKSGSTKVLQAQDALKKLRRTKVTIAGIVLNQYKKQVGYDDYAYDSYSSDLPHQRQEEVRLRVVK